LDGRAKTGNLSIEAPRQASKRAALAFDIGGTKISAAVFDGRNLASDIVRVPTPHGSEPIIEALIKLVNEFQESYAIGAIGISTAGIVDTVQGYPVNGTNNIPGWAGTHVKEIIERKTALSVYVENDANAAAYGEAKARNLSDSPCTIAITLGTGIGGGILLSGKVYHGFEYGGGSVGHFRICSENKRQCTCGLFDCWEAYGSGPGLLATAKQMLFERTAAQTSLTTNIESLTTGGIFAASTDGDRVAQEILRKWHQHVCAGLAILVPIFDPEAFILSGGLSKFVDLTMLTELLRGQIFPGMAEKLSIYESLLGPDACLIGAGYLALDALNVV
jgi:glucokinase